MTLNNLPEAIIPESNTIILTPDQAFLRHLGKQADRAEEKKEENAGRWEEVKAEFDRVWSGLTPQQKELYQDIAKSHLVCQFLAIMSPDQLDSCADRLDLLTYKLKYLVLTGVRADSARLDPDAFMYEI